MSCKCYFRFEQGGRTQDELERLKGHQVNGSRVTGVRCNRTDTEELLQSRKGRSPRNTNDKGEGSDKNGGRNATTEVRRQGDSGGGLPEGSGEVDFIR